MATITEIMQDETKAIRSVFIEGREWFDKQNGNSYWSARCWVDGEIVLTIGGLNYGYGDFYLFQSSKRLAELGYYEDSSHPVSMLRGKGVDFYYCKNEVKKRDMFKAY